MSDDQYADSLRPPGESVRPGTPPEITDEEIAPDAAPTGDDPVDDSVNRTVGYDAEAVSGDSELVRPD